MRKIIFYLLIAFMGFSCGKKELPKKTVTPVITNNIPAKKNQIKIIRVAIAPYHEIDSATTALIAKEFEEFYINVKTLILPREIMSDSLLANSQTRYNANKILNHLALIKPNEVNYILAITDDRIAACGDSIHETGVAGLGNRPGTCSVVSTAALKNKLPDSTQFAPRLIKATMHEMGHNFGLYHCKNKKDKKCLMRDAGGTVRTLDEEDVHLCDKCVDLLKQKGINVRKKTRNNSN